MPGSDDNKEMEYDYPDRKFFELVDNEILFEYTSFI
jgi:hypothetical protein